jgi:hypothetical protein
MNQLNQLVANIDGRNPTEIFSRRCGGRRIRRFGGGLLLGDENAGEEE